MLRKNSTDNIFVSLLRGYHYQTTQCFHAFIIVYEIAWALDVEMPFQF